MTDNTFTLTKGERTKGQKDKRSKGQKVNQRSTNITQKIKDRATRTISLNWSTATNVYDQDQLH